jgi:hypothetical protein
LEKLRTPFLSVTPPLSPSVTPAFAGVTEGESGALFSREGVARPHK